MAPRWLTVAVIWSTAALLTLWVAEHLSIGPVVLTLGVDRGVHAGDLAVGVACAGVAAAVTSKAAPRRP